MIEEPPVEELLRSAHRSVENGDFGESDELCCRAYERLTNGLADYNSQHANRKLSEQDLQNVLDCSALVVSQIQRLEVSQPEYRACLRMLAKLCERSGKIEESKVLHIRANELDRKYVTAQLFVEHEKMTYLNLSTILDLGPDIVPAGEEKELKPEDMVIVPDLTMLDVAEPQLEVSPAAHGSRITDHSLQDTLAAAAPPVRREDAEWVTTQADPLAAINNDHPQSVAISPNDPQVAIPLDPQSAAAHDPRSADLSPYAATASAAASAHNPAHNPPATISHSEHQPAPPPHNNPLEAMSANPLEAMSANPLEAMSANPLEAMSANPLEAMSANPPEAMSANPPEAMSANPLEAMSANPLEAMSANPLEAMSANPLEAMSANPLEAMSISRDSSAVINHFDPSDEADAAPQTTSHPPEDGSPLPQQSFSPGAPQQMNPSTSLQEAKPLPETSSAPPSPETLIFISAAKSAFQSGDFEEAIRCYRVVLQQLKQDELEEEEDAIDAHLAKGAAHVAVGELTHAISEYTNLAVILEKRMGQTHPYYIAHLHRLSKTLERAGRVSEAQSIIVRAAKLAEIYLPPQDELRIRVAEVHDAMRKMNQQSLRESIDQADKMTIRDMVSDDVVRKQVLDRPDQLRTISWFLCSALICAAAILWWPMITEGLRLNGQDTVTRAEPTKPVLPGQVFRASDDTALLSIINDHLCILTVDGLDRKIPYVLLRNDWTDVGQMCQDALLGRKVWIQRVPSGLIVDEALALYRSDAPELKIVSEMRRVGQRVQEHYQKFKTYPQNEEEWAKLEWTAYINPANGKPEQPHFQVFSRFARDEDIFGGATTNDGIKEFLIHGGNWSNEATAAPFRIDCASRCSTERHGRTYAAPYFFLHGSDRSGAFIAGHEPGTNLAILLHSGNNLGNLDLSKREPRTPNIRTSSELPNAIVYISNEAPLLFGVLPLKYILTWLGIVVLALLVGIALQVAVRRSKPGVR